MKITDEGATRRSWEKQPTVGASRGMQVWLAGAFKQLDDAGSEDNRVNMQSETGG